MKRDNDPSTVVSCKYVISVNRMEVRWGHLACFIKKERNMLEPRDSLIGHRNLYIYILEPPKYKHFFQYGFPTKQGGNEGFAWGFARGATGKQQYPLLRHGTAVTERSQNEHQSRTTSAYSMHVPAYATQSASHRNFETQSVSSVGIFEGAFKSPTNLIRKQPEFCLYP